MNKVKFYRLIGEFFLWLGLFAIFFKVGIIAEAIYGNFIYSCEDEFSKFLKIFSVVFLLATPIWLGGFFLWCADKLEKKKMKKWIFRLILFIIILIIYTFLCRGCQLLDSA